MLRLSARYNPIINQPPSASSTPLKICIQKNEVYSKETSKLCVSTLFWNS